MGFIKLALLAGWTHPGYASLADPLYGFAGKRVKNFYCVFLYNIIHQSHPSYGEAVERVTQRSDGRVSPLRLFYQPPAFKHWRNIRVVTCKPAEHSAVIGGIALR